MSDKKQTDNQPSTSSGAVVQQEQPQHEQNILARMMDRMLLEKQQRKEAKDKYAFWETQPVMQFTEGSSSNVSDAVRCPNSRWPSAWQCCL